MDGLVLEVRICSARWQHSASSPHMDSECGRPRLWCVGLQRLHRRRYSGRIKATSATSWIALVVGATSFGFVRLAVVLRSRGVSTVRLRVAAIAGAAVETDVVSLHDLRLASRQGSLLRGPRDVWEFVVDTVRQRPFTGYGFASFWMIPTMSSTSTTGWAGSAGSPTARSPKRCSSSAGGVDLTDRRGGDQRRQGLVDSDRQLRAGDGVVDGDGNVRLRRERRREHDLFHSIFWVLLVAPGFAALRNTIGGYSASANREHTARSRRRGGQFLIEPAVALGPASSGMIAFTSASPTSSGPPRWTTIRRQNPLARRETWVQLRLDQLVGRDRRPVLERGWKPVDIESEPVSTLAIGLRPHHGGCLSVGTKNPHDRRARNRVVSIKRQVGTNGHPVDRNPWLSGYRGRHEGCRRTLVDHHKVPLKRGRGRAIPNSGRAQKSATVAGISDSGHSLAICVLGYGTGSSNLCLPVSARCCSRIALRSTVRHSWRRASRLVSIERGLGPCDLFEMVESACAPDRTPHRSHRTH